MVTKYRLQVKWGHKEDFGPIRLRPDVTPGWHCVASVCGWKVPALSIVRYINSGYSHNPSRAAAAVVRGLLHMRWITQENPSNSKHMSKSIALPLPQDRWKSLSESRGQWESVQSGLCDTDRDAALVSTLLGCISTSLSEAVKLHRYWNKLVLHRQPLVRTSISFSPYAPAQ